jgi:DNA polymerase-3 subunit beta
MKICVPAQSLLDGLRKVLSVVSTRSTIPVLSNALLSARDGKLYLSTTDLEVSITTSMDATVEAEGETTLPAKKFGQIIGTLPDGDVTLETDTSMTTHISCANASFKIMGLDAAEFPTDAPIEGDRQLIFPMIEFGKTLKKIAYSVSSDQTRYVLNGILLSVREGNFTAVATDGRRLALVEKMLGEETAFEGDVILPHKVVVELQKLLDGEGTVTISISDSRASFEMGNTTLMTKLVEGTYPNYRQVIPASFDNSVILPREVFAEVLNRVSVVVTDSGASIKFKLETGNLTLSASSSEVGEASEPLEVSYQGKTMDIAFNPGYLRDPLKNLDCDELTMRLNDEFKPVVILGDEGFLYVIMPMRN